MSERKSGAGSRLSGVLERATPRDDPADGREAPPAEPAPEEPAEPTRGRGAAPKKARSRVSSLAKGVSGHTVYMQDALFELVMVKAHRRKMTISEYVTWVLEGELGGRKRAAAETTEAA